MIRPKMWSQLTALAALIVALFAVPVPAFAQDAGNAAPAGTIVVVGEGTVRLEPDIARANIGVDVLKPSVREASAENRAIVEAVMDALQEQGVAPEDMQTSGFSVFAERYGPEGPRAEEDTLYRVTNSITVTIRDLEKVGAILDAAVEAGANNIYGVEFKLENTDDAKAEARKLAVEDAGVKATQLAEYAQVSVGNIVSISQVIGGNGGLYLGAREQFAAGLGGGGGTPIVPGQIEVNETVQITYAIAE
ncbi:MAG: SIMPL domain-containing protein [Caldilineaceae bacterium]